MSIKIMIPTPLRPYTGNQDEVELSGPSTVKEALDSLIAKHSELGAHLYDTNGQLRRFINIYLNEEDIRYIDGESSALSSSDVLSIVPSIAGGSVD